MTTSVYTEPKKLTRNILTHYWALQPFPKNSVLVKPTTPHRQIKLQTGLQAIAIRATLGKTITRDQPNSRFHGRDIFREIGLLP